MAIAFAVGSCRPDPVVDDPGDEPVGVRVTEETFAPDRLPYEDGLLTLAGTTYPVRLRREVEDDGTHFVIFKGQEVLDREVYVLDRDAFRIRLAAGVQYEPPIPLLEFGRLSGDEWTWRGHVVTGGERLSAAATIRTSEEDLNLAGTFDRGLRVRATLELEGAGPDGTLQKPMTFWFAPRVGLVKREFGSTSTRTPAP